MLKNGRALIQLCMLFLVLSQLALRYLRPVTHVSQDASDAVGGFCLGVAIVLLALGARALKQRPASCA